MITKIAIAMLVLVIMSMLFSIEEKISKKQQVITIIILLFLEIVLTILFV